TRYTACGCFCDVRCQLSVVRRKTTDNGPRTTDQSMSESTTSNQIDPDLLSILRCPLTRSRLRQEGDFLIAEVGGLAYPVRDGIPVMLVEEAKLPTGVESLEAFKSKFGGQIPQ